MPWVRWPPWARFMPRIRSPGWRTAEVRGHVGLRAGVRLDVDVLCAREERERTVLGEPLGDVHVLAAAVVALARQALGVLVRQPGALGLHDGGRDVVLAGDELDLVVLAAALADHRLPQLGVDVGDRLKRDAPTGEMVMVRRLLPAGLVVRPTRRALSSHERVRPRPTAGTSVRVEVVGDARGVEDAARRGTAMAPGRSTRGRSPEQSTTVEAGPPRAGPPSRTSSIASPEECVDLGRVATLGPAGEVGRGRSAAARGRGASARGAAWSGTRRPIVGVPGRERLGQPHVRTCRRTRVRPPGQKALRAPRRPGP